MAQSNGKVAARKGETISSPIVAWIDRVISIISIAESGDHMTLLHIYRLVYFFKGEVSMSKPNLFMWFDGCTSPFFELSEPCIEGIENVLDSLSSREINGIIIGPFYSAQISIHSTHARTYGPFDEDIYRKILRERIGNRTIAIKTWHQFQPNANLYKNTTLKPPTMPPDKKHETDNCHKLIKSAKERGMKVLAYGIVVQQTTLYPPENSILMKDIEGNNLPWNCLNDPGQVEYQFAYISDVINTYPEIDGYIIHHLEFPSYRLTDIFTCFCSACLSRMEKLGYSAERIYTSVKELYKRLHGIAPSLVKDKKGILDVLKVLIKNPSLLDWQRFRIDSVSSFSKNLYKRLKHNYPSLEINTDCLTASFSLLSGADLSELKEGSDFINPKFYLDRSTWSWRGRILDYLKTIKKWNSELSEVAILKFICQFLGLDGLEKIERPEDLNTKSMPVEFISSEIRKAVNMSGAASFVRPWITLDIDQEELRSLFRIMRKENIEGCLIRSYDRAPEDKLDLLRREMRD